MDQIIRGRDDVCYSERHKLHYSIRELNAATKHRFDFEQFKPIELKAMRYLRGEEPNVFARKIGVPYSDLIYYEKQNDKAPSWLAKRYIVRLGILPNEYERLKMLISGEAEGYEQDRHIPPKVRKEVLKRDHNQCIKCGSKDNLHIHHIRHFSKGGLHQVDNLETLCGLCHTEAHKGDVSYNAMKKVFGGIDDGN